MYLRYNYLEIRGIIDHEAELVNVPEDKIIYMSKEELIENTGSFGETIWSFNKKYEELPLVEEPKDTTKHGVNFYFTEEEYSQIKTLNPGFAAILFQFYDRLAVDEDGNLYDIGDDQEKTFKWYSFFLTI